MSSNDRNRVTSDDNVMITRTARRDERDTLADLFVEALVSDPVTGWLYGAAGHVRGLVEYLAIWIDHGLDAGVVEVAETSTSELAGAMVWWPGPAPKPASYTARLNAAVDPAALSRFHALDAALATARPREEHLCLGLAAVRPGHQRRGVGTVLLERRHRDLDTTGTSAYLVATTADAMQHFRRHGYRNQGHPIQLPDGPALHPMRRHPTGNTSNPVTARTRVHGPGPDDPSRPGGGPSHPLTNNH